MCGSNVVNSRTNWVRNGAPCGGSTAKDSWFRATRVLFALSLILGSFIRPVSWAEIVFNELHVQPGNAADPHEFIELFNCSDQVVDLSDWE